MTEQRNNNDQQQTHPVILFDGVCHFCSNSVQFVIKRDPEAKFRFAHLQSDFGQQQLKKYNVNNGDALSSMLLIDDGHAYTKSTAALKISRELSKFWPLMYGFIIIPKVIRDGVYDFIGNRRYKWFGKHEVCWVPNDERLKNRFLGE